MKKRVVILMAIILSIIACGCSNNAKASVESEGISQEYKDAMSKGKSNVIEEEYDKAVDYFKLALETKSDDVEAKNLIKQLNLLIEAKDSESHGAYFFQIEKIDRINDIKTETDVVKDKANDYKQTVLKNLDEAIDSFEAEINEGKYKSVQRDLEETIDECKKSDSFKDQLDRCEGLLKTCKAEKNKAKKQAQKQAQKQAALQAKKNKEQQTQKEIKDEWGDLAYDWGDDGDRSEYCDVGHHYAKAKDVSILENGQRICTECYEKGGYSNSEANDYCP